MKTGIVTFHRVNNLGAVLQSVALNEYINDNFCDCEIIDFCPNNSIPWRNPVLKLLSFVKKQVLRLKYPNKYLQEKRFNDFRKNHYILSQKTYYGDKDIKSNPPKYDVLISGSDQIFNTTLTGDSKSYYLTFDNETKKISYASSFGRESITDMEYDLIETELSKFDSLSVRELSAGDIIEGKLGVRPQLVMDPVFLLDKTRWENRCNEDMKIPYSEYIFVYSMESTELILETAEKIKNEYNLPVIIVRGGGGKLNIDGTEDSSCGPEEFLRYIRDAKIVVTNSFHGTAFSLIFEKEFVCVAHSTRNARIKNIMNLVGRENTVIDNVDKLEYANDFVAKGKDVLKNLSSYIDNSKKYLSKCLNEVNAL